VTTATAPNETPAQSAPTVDLNMGHKPQVEPVALNLLIVDRRVQRPLRPTRAAKIAAEMNLDALGLLAVSHRESGEYAIIDGAHRAEALRILGFTNDDVMCEVYTGLTLAEEAAMFRLRNNSEKVGYLDRFRVRVVEGEPTALAIADLLGRYGWKVENQTYDGVFAAVQRIERIYLLEPLAAERALSTLTRAWGHEHNAADGRIVEGLGLFYHRYGGAVDIDELTDRLSKFPGGPGKLIGSARGLRDLVGSTVPKAVAEIVVELYNARRKTRGLPSWRST
jgi:hypothetical protein